MAFGQKAKKGADPFLYAMRLLARREYSRQQIESKLLTKGFSASEASDCIKELLEAGYVNDTRFAQAFARMRASSGYGPRRIAMDLQNAGVDADQLDAALAACETDWSQLALDVISRRYSAAQLDDQKQYLKAVAMLLRRGFSHDQAYGAAKCAKSAHFTQQ